MTVLIAGCVLQLWSPARPRKAKFLDRQHVSPAEIQVDDNVVERFCSPKEKRGVNELLVTWLSALLPYLEETALDEMFDPTVEWPNYYHERNSPAKGNAEVWRTHVPPFGCPSDTQGREGYYDKNANKGPGFTYANYVGCFSADGTFLEPEDYDPGGGAGTCHLDPAINPSVNSGKRAIFNMNVSRRPKHITDGLSKTIAASELITPPDGSSDYRGMWWINLGCHYEHYYPPNAAQPDVNWFCDKQNSPCTPWAPCWGGQIVSARSKHPGGVNALRGDGSVAFINDNVDMLIWQGLGSIGSDEVVGEP